MFAENQVQTLMEELEFLRRVHEQEVKGASGEAHRRWPHASERYRAASATRAGARRHSRVFQKRACARHSRHQGLCVRADASEMPCLG